MISATLDSNIYVSALQFGGGPATLLGMARHGLIRIDISDDILAETIGVLRDKFAWEGYRLHFARLELLTFTNRVTPKHAVKVVDDPDDDRIIECAAEAGSDFIITNDKALTAPRRVRRDQDCQGERVPCALTPHPNTDAAPHCRLRARRGGHRPSPAAACRPRRTQSAKGSRCGSSRSIAAPGRIAAVPSQLVPLSLIS